MENQNSFTPLYSDLKEKLEDDILDRGLQGGVFLGTFHSSNFLCLSWTHAPEA